MKKLLQIEEAALLIVSIYALYFLKVEWWYYLLLVLAPDISMLGYFTGDKAGAIVYNIFHHKGVATLMFLFGIVFQLWLLQVIGILLFGHSSMDRMFGYGLKYFAGFKHTHLGKIGSDKNTTTINKRT
jgi:hypothetical protein